MKKQKPCSAFTFFTNVYADVAYVLTTMLVTTWTAISQGSKKSRAKREIKGINTIAMNVENVKTTADRQTPRKRYPYTKKL